MTAALKNELTSRQAQKLWALLRQHFVNFERTLEEIIEKRAWEAMGYESFAEAWTAQMGDITLAAEFRPHVVYAYFDQGASIADVAAGVKGISTDRAAALKRQRDNGVPPDAASMSTGRRPQSGETVVGSYIRKDSNAEASTVHVTLTSLKYKRYQKKAKQLGIALEDICREAIDEKFESLG